MTKTIATAAAAIPPRAAKCVQRTPATNSTASVITP